MMSAVETASISKPLTDSGMLRLRMPSSHAFCIIPPGNLCSFSISSTFGRISLFTNRRTVSTYICCVSFSLKSIESSFLF